VNLLYRLYCKLVIRFYRRFGPPRMLTFSSGLNTAILRSCGARIGNNVTIYSPLTLHQAENGYANLVISDNCILNGNIFLDLSAGIVLEDGASLGPGVIIMTHNRYNYNKFLEEKLAPTCGKKEVVIKKGAGVKAAAVITMGVTIGTESVVAAGAVVNRDVAEHTFVAGVPAKEIKKIE
jgi:maltose O-acetyltransferase